MNPNDILNKADHRDGMTVPDGYFDDFARRMAATLPPIDFEKSDEEQHVASMSLWQKVRPYVYMAAMFLGVWCMMNMFDIIRPSNNELSLETRPAAVAALNNDDFFNNYVAPTIDESALYDDLYDEGFDTIDFEYE